MSASVESAVKIRRCSRCIMPESVPGARLDANGECTWCRTGFPRYTPHGEEALRELIERHKRPGGEADVLVGVSGGKDSCFLLLEMVRKYGLRAEAFTYLHGASTGISLDNAKQVCRALGVRHHILSLKGDRHVETFRAFFLAWLEKQDPVVAAMTCVACKHLHLLGTRLAHRRGIPMMAWADSPMEQPPFVPTRGAGEVEDGANAPVQGTGRLARRLLGALATAPRFRRAFFRRCRTCVLGCLCVAPTGPYLRKRYPRIKQFQFFEYVSWDADTMRTRLREETGWRMPVVKGTDWHSDCLIHPLKDYMFLRMYGALYLDAHLSNQVRHGLMDRQTALEESRQGRELMLEELPRALDALGLSDLKDRIDLSCADRLS